MTQENHFLQSDRENILSKEIFKKFLDNFYLKKFKR